MNDSGLTEKFWKFNEKEPLGAIAVALYFFLLEIWKKNEQNDFSLSDTETCELLKITRPTIITLRQKLVTLGMIQYQSKNGLPGHYKIIPEYSPILSAFEIPDIKNEVSTTKRSQTFKKISRIKGSKKTIQKKKKTAENFLQKTENPQNQNLTSYDSPQIPTAMLIQVSENIPSLEEFTQYAKTLENYIPELDQLIKEKYDSWLGNGWKNGYDKPITNWKSSIKNSMPFLQSELQSSNTTSEKIALPTIKRPKSVLD